MTTDDLETLPDTTKPRSKPRTRSIVSWLALLAILIGVAAWFQLVHQQKKSRNNYSQLQNSFSQTQSNTAELSSDFIALKAQVVDQNEQLLNLASAFNRSQDANSAQSLDHTLADVDHYLSQANLNLNFNHNISDAIILLQAADKRLATLTDPSVFALRSQIATTLVKLQALPQPDLIGLLTQLTALSEQVEHLPLFALSEKTSQFKGPDAAVIPLNETWLAQSMRVSLDTLKSLVIIRHREQAITPLLAPMQEQFLRQNLRLILQQASWAVLQHNADVYRFSINQAQEWLQRYFADNDQASIALSNQLKALGKVDIAPITPDLTPLSQTVHDLQQKYAEHLASHDLPIKTLAAPAHAQTTVNSTAGELA